MSTCIIYLLIQKVLYSMPGMFLSSRFGVHINRTGPCLCGAKNVGGGRQMIKTNE